VRVLPLVMIATHLLIARITPTPAGADPRMKWLSNVTPLIFGVAMYGQPSGLMLYWLTSNLLQLAQQWWLGKRYA
jgi:YidC/Oxa1 family membrane protein insertase